MVSEKILLEICKKFEPTLLQKRAASRSQGFLRNLLEKSKLPILDSYLSGSYARDTALRPIDDVDIVFVIDPSHWTKNSWVPIFNPNPENVLSTFARGIRRRYPNSPVYRQGRSINLKLYNLDIDVVPAIPAYHNGTNIYIADRFAHDWILSNPKEHSRKGALLNQSTNGLYKLLVKLLKVWNSGLPSNAQVKSFLLETMAFHIFSSYSLPSLKQGLIYFWDHMAYAGGQDSKFGWKSVGISFSLFGNSVSDLGGTNGNVAESLDNTRRQKFVRYSINSRNLGLAVEKGRSDQRKVALWKQVFRL